MSFNKNVKQFNKSIVHLKNNPEYDYSLIVEPKLDQEEKKPNKKSSSSETFVTKLFLTLSLE